MLQGKNRSETIFAGGEEAIWEQLLVVQMRVREWGFREKQRGWENSGEGENIPKKNPPQSGF